jgi:hypothetical protein
MQHGGVAVTPTDFEALRDLPGKVISEDIVFLAGKNTSPVLTFDGIRIENALDVDLVVNGHFHPKFGGVTYNFFDRSAGAICRIDVNGQIHKKAGRTHKHSVKTDNDVRRNLPNASAVPQYVGKSPREIWEMVCAAANITHTGRFEDPSGP